MKRFKDFINEGLRDAMKPKDNDDVIKALEDVNIADLESYYIDKNDMGEEYVSQIESFFDEVGLNIEDFCFIDGSMDISSKVANGYRLIDSMILDRDWVENEDGGDVFCHYYDNPKVLTFADVYGDLETIAYRMEDAIKFVSGDILKEELNVRDAMKPKGNDEILQLLEDTNFDLLKDFNSDISEPIIEYFDKKNLDYKSYYFVDGGVEADDKSLSVYDYVYNTIGKNKGNVLSDEDTNELYYTFYKEQNIIAIEDDYEEIQILAYKIENIKNKLTGEEV